MDNNINPVRNNIWISESQERIEQKLHLSDVQPRETSDQIHYDPNEYLGRSQIVHCRHSKNAPNEDVQNQESVNEKNIQNTSIDKSSRILDAKTLESEKFKSKQEIKDFMTAYQNKHKYNSGVIPKAKIDEFVDIINNHPKIGGYVKLWAEDKNIKPRNFRRLIQKYDLSPQKTIELLGMKNIDGSYRFSTEYIANSCIIENLEDYPEISEYYLNLKNEDGSFYLANGHYVDDIIFSSASNPDYKKIIETYKEYDGSLLDIETYYKMISSGYSVDVINKLDDITDTYDIFEALLRFKGLDKLSDDELKFVVDDLKFQKQNNNNNWKDDITERLNNNIYQKIGEIINENTPGAKLISIDKDHYHKDAISFSSAIVDKTLITEFVINKKGKLLRKEIQIPNKKPLPKKTTQTKTKSNIIDYTYSNFYDNSTKVVKDNDGNVLFVERYKKSSVPNRYNIFRAENGKKYIVGLAEKSPKGDIIVEKTITSPDGTKNDYVYGQGYDGSRFIYNKITDSDGNILLDNRRKLKVFDGEHIQSTENGVTYDMKFDFFNDKVTVSKMDGDNVVDTVTQKFGKKTGQIAPELYFVMKKLPGSLFFKMRDLGFNQMLLVKDKCLYNNAAYDGYSNIGISPEQVKQDGAFTILHEFGHFLDDKYHLCTDTNLLKIFEQERANFLKLSSNKELDNMKYFIDEFHTNEEGAITEVIAETYALLNTLTADPNIILRGEYLQQYFPKTMAYIANKLETT